MSQVYILTSTKNINDLSLHRIFNVYSDFNKAVDALFEYVARVYPDLEERDYNDLDINDTTYYKTIHPQGITIWNNKVDIKLEINKFNVI